MAQDSKYIYTGTQSLTFLTLLEENGYFPHLFLSTGGSVGRYPANSFKVNTHTLSNLQKTCIYLQHFSTRPSLGKQFFKLPGHDKKEVASHFGCIFLFTSVTLCQVMDVYCFFVLYIN